MKNIPLKTTQDYSSLIGIPYEKKDCWGVVVSFYKLVFDIELNPYYQDIPKTKTEAHARRAGRLGIIHWAEIAS